jgi:hypothetical protein
VIVVEELPDFRIDIEVFGIRVEVELGGTRVDWASEVDLDGVPTTAATPRQRTSASR